ncbi:gamma-glutamylcyclotransferase family protein [Halomonas urumqiensis]|uniref:Gamma-glutamylcyclotransferase n=1 Tax=Halomonas urumqiensis TaxID=1684789 RepID=A0A2N7UEM5_9GAMM|nr:gamma-glutamylcyclotransferase family protein [Halomonas urumqiensis]PMR78904.1 gamma-glutamylcyclotransferase [Halomonas urumqiensis]PTB04190.1 gamma-glutamylcyclotransferase [Halomonas urumqiensis]GHE19538.1 hypothetical protein GCM10017767_00590 [Halomonas urumqiensis]
MTRCRLLLLTLVSLPLAAGFWLWLTMLSPFTYERPAHLPTVSEGPHTVFVYGTLRSSVVRWLVTGRAMSSEPAILDGFRRERLDLVSAPGARVEGEVIVVSADELARLDRYERLGIRYERIRQTLDDGREAWVYRRLPETARQGEDAAIPTRLARL